MYQKSDLRGDSPVSIIGAGIAGAWHALLFAQAGHAVTVHERSDAAMTHSTSHWAGGMLAPWCEAETSEPVIARLGIRSLDLWRSIFRKRRSTARWWWRMRATAPISSASPSSRPITGGSMRAALSELEPSLEGRFREGLFYPDEGHVEPRRVLPELHARDRQGRRHDRVQQRRERGRSRRHRDRLPRHGRARRAAGHRAASRAR